MEYVPMKIFKRLEQKVEQILEVYALQEKLSKKERAAYNRVKKDIDNKTNFVSLKDF